MQPHTWKLVLNLEVIPVSPCDIEQHLNQWITSKHSRLYNKGPDLPVDRQPSRNVQRTWRLQQVLGQRLILGERPKWDVDCRQLLGLEDHKAFGALKRVSTLAAIWWNSGLLEKEGQLCVGELKVSREINFWWTGGGTRNRDAEESIGTGRGNFTSNCKDKTRRNTVKYALTIFCDSQESKLLTHRFKLSRDDLGI